MQHTKEQCLQKLEGVKTLASTLIQNNATNYDVRALAESIITLCNELVKEFPEDMKKDVQNEELYKEIAEGRSLIEMYKQKCAELEQVRSDIKELQKDACYLCVRNEGVHY